MSACFDTDGLVDLSLLLGTDPMERLDHLAQCGSCRSELATVAALRAALADRSDRADEQALAAARAAIRREAHAERAARPGRRFWGPAAESVFAGLTALALGFWSGVVGPDLGPAILMSGACAGVVWIAAQALPIQRAR